MIYVAAMFADLQFADNSKFHSFIYTVHFDCHVPNGADTGCCPLELGGVSTTV